MYITVIPKHIEKFTKFKEKESRLLYHLEGEDDEAFLATLAEVSKECQAVIHAYCLMTNYYHLLVETLKAQFFDDYSFNKP